MFSSKKQRAQQEIELRRGRLETYTEPLPIDTATDIPDFLSYFYRHILFQQRNDEGIQLELQLHPTTTGKFYSELVLQQKTIAYEDFWQRYFYRTNSIERVMNELDIMETEKKKARPNKFPWRSSSSNSNTISANNSMDSDNPSTTTNIAPSLSDLIPQRVLSTSAVSAAGSVTPPPTTSFISSTTKSSSSNNSPFIKKTIFNDLLPKRKPRSSSHASLSPAASKDVEEMDDPPPPPPTTTMMPPIILDLHDEIDDTTTKAAVVEPSSKLDVLHHMSEPLEETTYMDDNSEYTTAVAVVKTPTILPPTIVTARINDTTTSTTTTTSNHQNNNNIPEDEDMEGYMEVQRITSSSSMDVVDTTSDDNVVEVTPKPKFFSSMMAETQATTNCGDHVEEVAGNTADRNNTPFVVLAPPTTTITTQELIVTEDVTTTMVVEEERLEPVLEVPAVTIQHEVVHQFVEDTTSDVSEMLEEVLTIVNNTITSDPNSKQSQESTEGISSDVTTTTNIPTTDSEQPIVPKSKDTALNIFDEVTQLCCNSSIDDDVIQDTTAIVTETIVATTTTVFADLVGVHPPTPVVIPETTPTTTTTHVDHIGTDAISTADHAIDDTTVSAPSDELVQSTISAEPTIANNTDIETLADTNVTTTPTTTKVDVSVAPTVIYDEDILNGATIVPVDVPNPDVVTAPTVVVVPPIHDQSSITMMAVAPQDDTIPTVIPSDDIEENNDGVAANPESSQSEPTPSISLTEETIISPPTSVDIATASYRSAVTDTTVQPFTDDDFLKAVRAHNDTVADLDFSIPVASSIQVESNETVPKQVAPLYTEKVDHKTEKELENLDPTTTSGLVTSVDTPKLDDTSFISAVMDSAMKTGDGNTEQSNAESVAALMVELPKRVPTTNDLSDAIPHSNHRFINPTEPPIGSAEDAAFDVQNPFDAMLASGVQKTYSISSFNETIDSMPLTPDIYQSWNTSAENANPSTNNKGVPELLHDAFDPFAMATPRGNLVATETSTAENTKDSTVALLPEQVSKVSDVFETTTKSAMEYAEKLIYEEFGVESDLHIDESIRSEPFAEKVHDTIDGNATTDTAESETTVETENIAIVNVDERGMEPQSGQVLKLWNTEAGPAVSSNIVESVTANDKESMSRGFGIQAVDLGRRLGDLFSSKKRKQSMDASDVPDVLEGFPSPKVAKHSYSNESMLLQSATKETKNEVRSLTVGDNSFPNIIGRCSLSNDSKPVYSKSLIPSDSVELQNIETINTMEGNRTILKQVPVEPASAVNRENRDDLNVFFKSISADDDQEAHLFDHMKSLEETENDLVICSLPIAPPDGMDSRAATPVTSNVDLTALERSNNITGQNGSTNGFLSYRSVSFVFLFLFGVAIAVVAQQWPWIVVAIQPTMDQICGPVPPGWTSLDHPTDTVTAEAPYWVPTNNTNVKQQVFQILCGVDRVRTVMKITPTNNKDLYWFELLEVVANTTDTNHPPETTTLIKKQKIRSVHVSFHQIALTRPRGKVEWYHPNWVVVKHNTTLRDES